jgi:GT2 family glycosyltransferase
MSHSPAPPATPTHPGETAAPRVAAVVLNWHGRAHTLECLRALAALSYPRLSLILIDNGCKQFSAEEVASLFPNARYLHSAVNLGFAGGANLGMRSALDNGADYVWFVNQDAQPEPESLRELLAVAERDTAIAIVGPKILQQADPQRLDSIALRVDLRSGRLYLTGHDEIDRGQYDHLTEVDAVSGCAMLLRRSASVHLGGFDEGFFAYVEDADLCLRARAAGLRVCAAPRARVRHDRVPAAGGRQSVSSLYYATRNHLVLIRRHAPPPRLPRLFLVVALNVAYALRGTGGACAPRLHAVWRAVCDYGRGVQGGSWEE